MAEPTRRQRGTSAGPPGQPALEFRAVSKTFGGDSARVQALADVSFEVHPGELVVLRGPSGSGKSTLIHLAAGLETPTSGTVKLGGIDLGGLDDERLSRMRCTEIGLVFQAFHLIDYLTAEDNVALPLRLAGKETAEAVDMAREALSRVGLTHRAEHRPSELSGGEQQRVAVARALVVRPSIILADEPTGSLDSRMGAEILGLLRDVNERMGVALLLATHDERAAATAPRLLELRDGAVFSGTAQEGRGHHSGGR